MSVSVEQAMEEAAAKTPAPMAQANLTIPVQRPVPTIATALKKEAAALAACPGGAALPGTNPQDFIAANRIHIKDGSLFVDPYLVIHPRELDPANETALRRKLTLTYSINSPSFYESRKRAAVAVNLSQLIPISNGAIHTKLMEAITAYNKQVESGVDTQLSRELAAKNNPFATIVSNVTEKPAADPAGVEMLTNGLAMYLLLREKLTQAGYMNSLTDYVMRAGTPDQVLADLAPKIGVTPLAVREAALKGGLDAVGQLLGLDARYVADVKALSAYAATQDFSYNLVEHWHLGRQLQGIAATMQDKLTVGLDARITAKIAEFREKVHHRFNVPDSINAEEKRIAEALTLVDPIQRAMLFKLGYEIGFSPEATADEIAYYRGIYGLHRKAANDLRDVRGTYRIYFAGRGNLEESMRTFVHEIAHNLWPEQFSAEEAAKIDALAKADAARFIGMKQLLDQHGREFDRLFAAYRAGDPAEKSAVLAAANEQFKAYDFHAEGLFPYLRDTQDFKFAVAHAVDTLRIEGDRYNRSGYNSPQERFREVISRFAELKQVRYRGEPQFLQFLAPGLNQVWENHYLPHLARVHQSVVSGELPLTQKANAAKPNDNPKVENRPAPTAHGSLAVDGPGEIDHVETPSYTVDAGAGIFNERALPAYTALSGMGITPQF